MCIKNVKFVVNMGTEILKSFGTLQSELEQARSSLKGVDESIKRLIGRDPSEIVPRPGPGVKRSAPTEEVRGRQRLVINVRNRSNEGEEQPAKRRNGSTSVFKRLSDRPVHYEDEFMQQPQKQMISKVIVTPREVPSRQEALAAQSSDEKFKARNRRMFGALLGTLQKFQQEETKLKQKEEKRAQVEKKIEEHEIKEKAEIKKERQELFFNRKKKQAEIKMIELKMMRMKEYAIWEEKQKPRMNFIQTKAKPHIYYLPRKLNDTSKELLEAGKKEVEKMLDIKRQEVFDELQHIEDRMKKNFEPKKTKQEQGMEMSEPNEEINNGDSTATKTDENTEELNTETSHNDSLMEEEKNNLPKEDHQNDTETVQMNEDNIQDSEQVQDTEETQCETEQQTVATASDNLEEQQEDTQMEQSESENK